MKERNLFLGVVGEYPYFKILDFFITFKYFDYSISDISRNSKVSYKNTELILPRLSKLGLITETRKVGRAKMYKLNLTNPLTKILVKMHWLIVEQQINKKYGLGLETEKIIERKIKIPA